MSVSLEKFYNHSVPVSPLIDGLFSGLDQSIEAEQARAMEIVTRCLASCLQRVSVEEEVIPRLAESSDLNSINPFRLVLLRISQMIALDVSSSNIQQLTIAEAAFKKGDYELVKQILLNFSKIFDTGGVKSELNLTITQAIIALSSLIGIVHHQHLPAPKVDHRSEDTSIAIGTHDQVFEPTL